MNAGLGLAPNLVGVTPEKAIKLVFRLYECTLFDILGIE